MTPRPPLLERRPRPRVTRHRDAWAPWCVARADAQIYEHLSGPLWQPIRRRSLLRPNDGAGGSGIHSAAHDGAAGLLIGQIFNFLADV